MTATPLRSERRAEGTHDLLLGRSTGRAANLIHPDRLASTFARLSKVAGLPTLRLHDLRNSWASIALSAGVHARIVSEQLGHSSVSVTLDVYSHAVPPMAEHAAAEVAALIFGE